MLAQIETDLATAGPGETRRSERTSRVNPRAANAGDQLPRRDLDRSGDTPPAMDGLAGGGDAAAHRRLRPSRIAEEGVQQVEPRVEQSGSTARPTPPNPPAAQTGIFRAD
jgi:hypothetical protein